MYSTEKIKSVFREAGADLCGITSASQFKDASQGFQPTDIFPKCRSVIVFAKRLSLGSINASSSVPYSFVNSQITKQVDEMTLKLSLILEDIGIENVPIPCDDPYEYWEPENQYGRTILFLRHAGYLAGLGVLGKNTRLINEKFGNMIQLRAY